MRIAFYAPLKSPAHSVPSGDRRVGRLFVDALERAGHQVELASSLRSYDPAGDPSRQAKLREEGLAIANDLVAGWEGNTPGERPDLWFTYHVYHKAPDWLGPLVCSRLRIPYVIAEASYAPKRANGPWALGHVAARDAIQAAALVVCPIRDDIACVEPLIQAGGGVMLLPPFLDHRIYVDARKDRALHRQKLRDEHRLDPDVPWIVTAAMMRAGDKLASYRSLAAALAKSMDIPWRLVVVGDGPARSEVQLVLDRAIPGRACFLGEREHEEVADIYAACDLCIWPAVNEAYGMAMLEAEAAGLPVVSRAVRGVPDVVCQGRTGLLAPAEDEAEFAALARHLLTDGQRRSDMGKEAARFVSTERSVESASAKLDRALVEQCGSVTQRAQLISR
jgi:glycosyltransferase involved in cell wall biosynthesis